MSEKRVFESVDTDEEDLSFVHIFSLAVRIRLWKMGDWIRTFFFYYIRSLRFLYADTLLLLRYFWKSPYRLIRNHDEENALQYGPYGETPFRTLDSILHQFSIPVDFAFIDAGSGRGRSLLWLRLFRGQRHVIGIEPFAPFNETLRQIIGITKTTSIEVHDQDIYSYLERALNAGKTDFSNTALYLYMSSLPDKECVRLSSLFSRCHGLHIVSVSFWLGEFGASNISLISRQEFSFPWGFADVFYQKVKEEKGQ